MWVHLSERCMAAALAARLLVVLATVVETRTAVEPMLEPDQLVLARTNT